MKYRLLGNSGFRVSEAALGTMTFGEEWARQQHRTGVSLLPLQRVNDPSLGLRRYARQHHCLTRNSLQ
jgi:hypothetical protein